MAGELPPGFTLDAPSAPALPPGFKLDNPVPVAAPKKRDYDAELFKGNTMDQVPYEMGAKVNDFAAKHLPAPVAAGLGTATNFIMQALPMVAGGGAIGEGASFAKAASKRVALAEELKRQKQPMLDTLKEVRDAGYSIPPSYSNPTVTNRILESFGGKAATQQEASLGNADVTNKLIRTEIGAPSDMGITNESLDALRTAKAQPYRDVAELPAAPPSRDFSNINPNRNPYPLIGHQPQQPEILLNEWRDTNLRAKLLWGEYQKNGSVTAYDNYQKLRAHAGAIETAIEDAANVGGRPELIAALRGARTDIAKIHDVERALNTDRGEVSAIDLARAKDKGVPLSGGLKTAAKMGNAYPKAIQAPEKIGSPAVNNLVSGISAATGAGIGAATGGPAASMAGGAAGAVAVPLMQMTIRKMLLSPAYQKFMGTPNYDPSLLSRILSKAPEGLNANNLAYTLYLSDLLRKRGEPQ